MLEREARRRAVEGVEEPVGFYKGEPSAYVRKYSDTLLIFLMKGARPDKYRDRWDPRVIEMTPEGPDSPSGCGLSPVTSTLKPCRMTCTTNSYRSSSGGTRVSAWAESVTT